MAEMASHDRDLFVGENAETQLGPVREFLESVTDRRAQILIVYKIIIIKLFSSV